MTTGREKKVRRGGWRQRGHDGGGGGETNVRKLYTPGQVGFASFMGTPLAGSWLMAENERTLERSDLAERPLYFGLIATAAFITAVLYLRGPLALSVAFWAASFFTTFFFAQWAQGEALARALEKSVRRHRNASVLRVGFKFGVVLSLLLWALSTMLFKGS